MSTDWCFICQCAVAACMCPRNAPIDQEHAYLALRAIHDAVGGCGHTHDAVFSYRSCLMAEIPRLKKKLAKAEKAAEQQGRGVNKLRKKLETLMHASKENKEVESQPAAIPSA